MAKIVEPEQEILVENTQVELPKQNPLKKLLPTIIICILLIAGSVYYIYSQNIIKSLSVNPPQKNEPTTAISKTPSSDPQLTPIYDSNDSWQFKLMNNKTLVTYLGPQRNNVIEKWNNFLFYPESNNRNLLATYDMTTDKKDYFELNEYISEMVSLNEITILNNEIYLSFGGYMQKAGIYYASLPLKKGEKFTTLIEGSNPRIEKIKNQYLIIGGDGDGCGGTGKYWSFEPSTKQVTFITDAHFGCSEGAAYLGLDTSNRMIMSNHVNDTSEENTGIPRSIYSNVYAIPVSSPSTKESLIDEATMPQNIYDVKYAESTNQILLSGESIYTFDINSKQLTKILDVPEEWDTTNTMSLWTGSYACLKDYSADKTLVINVKEKKIDTDTSVCIEPNVTPTPTGTYAQQMQQTIREKIEKLDLPSGFKLILEE